MRAAFEELKKEKLSTPVCPPSSPRSTKLTHLVVCSGRKDKSIIESDREACLNISCFYVCFIFDFTFSHAKFVMSVM